MSGAVEGVALERRIVGREGELETVERLLVANDAKLRGLLVEGEPGIGKTTVWQAGVERARALGLGVLSCRPVEAETKLAFASLADLFAPVVDEALPLLADPQRLALEAALLRRAQSGAAPDRRAIGMAANALLRGAAAASPLLVAIDDVQWLDRASAAALAFALRRLDGSVVRLLVAQRLERGASTDVLDLDRTVPDGLERLRLEPLSLSGLYHVIRGQVGHVFPRPTLQRIAQTSRGNPLFAVELARALAEAGARPGPGEPLPVPESVGALLEGRIRRLPATVREVLLVVSALSNPAVGVVGVALGRDVEEELGVAEGAEIVRVREGRVVFRHPLLASTVYSSASAASRRAVHRALAENAAEPEERARHLALATPEADERVAASLQSGAAEVAARGAPEVAVELAELACRLTPPGRDVERAERSLAFAEYLFRAGDGDEASRVAREVIADAPSGQLRARARELVARVLHVTGTAPEAAAQCLLALEDVGSNHELEARVRATAALVSWHDFGLAREHAHAAVVLLEQLDQPDPGVLSQALMAYAQAEFYTGHELPMNMVERGLELERLAPAPSVADRLSAALGAWLKYEGDFEGARRWLDATYQAALDEGDEGSLPYVLSHLPQLELWTGNWERAERLSREHLELADVMAQPDQRRQALFNLAMVHAHMGRVEEARAEAAELLTSAEAAGEDWGVSNALAVLGLLELSLSRPAEAAAYLARMVAIRETAGNREPLRSYGDYAEPLVELGELDRAEEVVALLEARARAANRVPQLAVAAWGRALVAAGNGDLDRAAVALDEALALHDRVTVPFDLARTLIAVGQVNRRRGERRAARDALERARGIFEELGAPLWIARAEAELRRIPIRRGAGLELTPTEEQVAQLVAAGRTTREVAQALFVSPKTVEANLTRIYRKLGIASRAELGATMAERKRG